METTIATALATPFAALLEGAKFIINDVFVGLIVKDVLLNPEAAIVWVPVSIGVGFMLFNKMKNPLK